MFVESFLCLELCACFLTLTVTKGSSHVFDNIVPWVLEMLPLGTPHIHFFSYSTREMSRDGGT